MSSRLNQVTIHFHDNQSVATCCQDSVSHIWKTRALRPKNDTDLRPEQVATLPWNFHDISMQFTMG